ncbi:MAG: hypothetical protein ABIQ40_13240 [Bacteroidia bacterium]
MNSSYIPVSDADRVVWLYNFGNRLSQYATALGLTPAEITSVQRDAAMFTYVVQMQDAAHQYWTSLSGLKRQLRSAPQQIAAPAIPVAPAAGSPPSAVNSGIFNRVILLVARIKQSSAYSETMGQDLNIIPSVTAINPNDMVPNLSIRLEAGHPLLKWKKGDADGVQLYVDRRDTNGFVLLAKVFRNTYLDVLVLPANIFTATWDYKARYLIGDDEVGQFSTVISINVLRTA